MHYLQLVSLSLGHRAAESFLMFPKIEHLLARAAEPSVDLNEATYSMRTLEGWRRLIRLEVFEPLLRLLGVSLAMPSLPLRIR